jgi:hypothetical protein
MFIVFPQLLFSCIYHFLPSPFRSDGQKFHSCDNTHTKVNLVGGGGGHSKCRVFQFHHQYFGPQLTRLLAVICLPAEGNHSQHLLKYGKNLRVTAKQELKLLSIFFKYSE